MKKPVAKKKEAAKAAKQPSKSRLAIDQAAIRDLAKILDETGLTEITWVQGGTQVKVARGVTGSVVSPAAAAAPVAAHAAPAEAAVDVASHPGAVKSPMVGTAYVAAEPGGAAFVKIGDTVRQGQTVLIVEAMKTMNPIPAPKGGRVTQVMIADKQPVEFGQVLMVIE
jgi:acetyl-CoA carboxylase biotin carboxyl carrier protein